MRNTVGNAAHNRRSRAFSLVELLVVIGIIAVVISLLLPALTRAKLQAKSAACKSNMRQVSLALKVYAMDNNGWLFPTDRGAGEPHERRWPMLVFKPPVWNPPVL